MTTTETTQANDQAIAIFLRANVAALPQRDQAFAHSLLAAEARGTATEKQSYWICKLAERIATAKPAPAPVNVGDFTTIQAIFDVAASHLKRPMIRVRLESGRTLKLYRAGAKSVAPGAVNVKDDLGNWFGRVMEDGSWQGRHTTPESIIETVRAIGADPAGFLGANGRLTGHCCFCGLALTDARSLEVGYGPICAASYELPWGAKAQTVAA